MRLLLDAHVSGPRISFDVKDFPDIARSWAEADRPHAGLAIVAGIDHGEFGTILRALDQSFKARPAQDDWANYTCFVSRPRPSKGTLD